MFGHLDDPTESPPGAREMEKVVRRAQAIRGRRRVTLVASCVVVLAGLAGFLATRPASPRISATETGFQFNALKGPLAIGTPVPVTALINVVFVDGPTDSRWHLIAATRCWRRRPTAVRPGT